MTVLQCSGDFQPSAVGFGDWLAGGEVGVLDRPTFLGRWTSLGKEIHLNCQMRGSMVEDVKVSDVSAVIETLALMGLPGRWGVPSGQTRKEWVVDGPDTPGNERKLVSQSRRQKSGGKEPRRETLRDRPN